MTVMSANAQGPNKTLEGHKLILLMPWTPSEEFLERLRVRHPGLQVLYYSTQWSSALPADIPPEEWEDATILLTGASFPTPELAPKLEYVQLMSAGANHILQDPLFVDTDVTFCTANGVHG